MDTSFCELAAFQGNDLGCIIKWTKKQTETDRRDIKGKKTDINIQKGTKTDGNEQKQTETVRNDGNKQNS